VPVATAAEVYDAAALINNVFGLSLRHYPRDAPAWRVAYHLSSARSEGRREGGARHVEEHEAESYAHRALAAHGFEVPEVSTYGTTLLRWGVHQRRPRQMYPDLPVGQAFALGRRSPYASLPSVDAFRCPKESGPERTCACRCALDQADMYSTSSTLDNSARAAA
jgi:hypothetical protein